MGALAIFIHCECFDFLPPCEIFLALQVVPIDTHSVILLAISCSNLATWSVLSSVNVCHHAVRRGLNVFNHSSDFFNRFDCANFCEVLLPNQFPILPLLSYFRTNISTQGILGCSGRSCHSVLQSALVHGWPTTLHRWCTESCMRIPAAVPFHLLHLWTGVIALYLILIEHSANQIPESNQLNHTIISIVIIRAYASHRKLIVQLAFSVVALIKRTCLNALSSCLLEPRTKPTAAISRNSVRWLVSFSWS